MPARPSSDRAGGSPTAWPPWTARATLVAWWGAMFIATHLPIQETLGEPPVPDKLAHFVIYGGLGFLLPMWPGWWSRLTWRRAGLCLAAIAAYALFDELTQIPVGRSAEWLDGLADLCGAALGIAAAALMGNNAAARDRMHALPEES